jgi:hypothetical protein
MIDRELIYSQLFARFSALPGVRTASRILKHWNDVPSEMQPAVYVAQTTETAIEQPSPLAQKWRLSVDLYLYVSTSGQVPPATLLNPLLDAIEQALVPHPSTGRCTLGIEGVEWAAIDGTIETDEGTLGNQAVAIVPISIVAA